MELAGKRLLILEDEYLIGLELERIVEECGAQSVQTVSTIEQLMEQIAGEAGFDIAILEVEARGIPSFTAAALLRARGIPLLFTSAYDADLKGIARFPGVPVVGKPYGKSNIVQALAAMSASIPVNVPENDDPSGELV